MQDEENKETVSQARNVKHADIVTNAEKTNIAGNVSHADVVGMIEVHGEPIRSDRTRQLAYMREIARNLVTFFALLVMIVVIYDKNANEDVLHEQLKKFQTERATADKVTADKLECVRRFTDAIDANTAKQLLLIGDFLIVITQNPPGPERTAAVISNTQELQVVNRNAREAVSAKIEYNNQGNPLPCPVPPSSPPALTPEPQVTVPTSTTTIVTPTT